MNEPPELRKVPREIHSVPPVPERRHMVGVSYTQHWRLRRMDRWMSRSDPHLAAMLAIFARLTAGEAIASIEQARFRHTRPWGNLVRMGQALWLLLPMFAGQSAGPRKPSPGRGPAGKDPGWVSIIIRPAHTPTRDSVKALMLAKGQPVNRSRTGARSR